MRVCWGSMACQYTPLDLQQAACMGHMCAEALRTLLTMLMLSWHLHGNPAFCPACSGTLPDHLAALGQLQWLLLDDNKLNDTLPAYLGQMPNLQQARLQDNNFSGPVPASWCSGSAMYNVASNPFLCGRC